MSITEVLSIGGSGLASDGVAGVVVGSVDCCGEGCVGAVGSAGVVGEGRVTLAVGVDPRRDEEPQPSVISPTAPQMMVQWVMVCNDFISVTDSASNLTC